MAEVAGQVISGTFDDIIVRQKSGAGLQIGQLLTAKTSKGKVLLQVFNLTYASQMSQQNLEMISGMKLESENDLEVFESEQRNYMLAHLKPLIVLENGAARVCKTLPEFFSRVYELGIEDFGFLERPDNALLMGRLRSGSRTVDLDVFLDGESVFSHHVLVAAQTGRGKSNMMSCLIASGLEGGYAGFLVLDPHDEYFGRNRVGLKDLSQNIVYYTPSNPPAGARSLRINLKKIKPSHFNGAVFWSEAQKEALYAYYRKYGADWIEAVLLGNDEGLSNMFSEATIAVARRRLMQSLNLDVANGIYPNGIFDTTAGMSTVGDIADSLEQGKAVIIDTSTLGGTAEILVGSIVSSEVFRKYQGYKAKGELAGKPVVSIILEEAPRVLGSDVLEQGPNIFSRIAREGRKFKIGIIALTQLPSLIPRQILANIGTKIVLGIEMAPERKAIIESAAQDLSRDDRAIASLDVGEALITSTFSKFAIPVRSYLFSELIANRPESKSRAYPELGALR